MQTKTGIYLMQEGNEEPFNIRLHLAKDILTIQEQDVICVSGEPFYSSVSSSENSPGCLSRRSSAHLSLLNHGSAPSRRIGICRAQYRCDNLISAFRIRCFPQKSTPDVTFLKDPPPQTNRSKASRGFITEGKSAQTFQKSSKK